MTKLQKIQQLRKRGFILKRIGEIFGLSAERVRQILLHKKMTQRCSKHDISFYEFCQWCKTEQVYNKILADIKKKKIGKEIVRLSRQDRHKNQVIQRSLLVKKLRDEYGLSFSKIGRLLKRDHTSILNAYYNNYEKKEGV